MASTYYLIIGNGIAGYEAAKAIRKNDQENTILIIGDEEYETYRRLQLSHALATEDEINDLYVVRENESEKLKIDKLLGHKVTNIDTDNNEVTIDNDRKISYQKLLITTGSNAFIPKYQGEKYDNIYKLRRYTDLEAIRKGLDSFERIVVSGGGLLGLELAYSLLSLGKKVEVVEFGQYLLNKQLDKKTSLKLKDDLENLGFTIHTGTSVEKVLGDGKLEEIHLTNGQQIKADALIFSVGVRANLDIIPDEINTNRCILVDHFLKTNIDNIWSAGDCVEIDGQGFGLWTASNQMGKIAGNNMSGGNEEYYPQALFTNMRLGDIRVYSIGEITDDSLRLGSDDEFKVLFFKDNLLVGGILYGSLKDMGKLKVDVNLKKRKEEFYED